MEHIEELKGEGDRETVVRVRKRRSCVVCGEPADARVTYLFKNARINPASSAYGHDDCSRCSDAEEFACSKHEMEVRHNPPEGTSWCSSFPAEHFPHMVLYWETVKTPTTSTPTPKDPLEDIDTEEHENWGDRN